jgi:uncharacterized protein (DUF427 family)
LAALPGPKGGQVLSFRCDHPTQMFPVIRAPGAAEDWPNPPSIGPMTVTASYQGLEIARSDDTVVVEGNHYFPAVDVREGALQPSRTHTHCSWKGEASYDDVVVGGHRNPDAAWYYPTPKEAAAEIADRVAFWNGVTVSVG